MTVKERLRRIIDELPEEMPETVIEEAKDVLRPYREPVAPANGRQEGETPEERRTRVESVVGALAHVPGSSEDYYRRKSEKLDREE